MRREKPVQVQGGLLQKLIQRALSTKYHVLGPPNARFHDKSCTLALSVALEYTHRIYAA